MHITIIQYSIAKFILYGHGTQDYLPKRLHGTAAKIILAIEWICLFTVKLVHDLDL